MRRGRARAMAALVVSGGVAIFACQDPTQVTIEVRTNVPAKAGVVTAFTVGAPGTTEDADSTTETSEPWGADGFVGSLAVVPPDAKDGPLSVKVVMGVLRDPRDCSIAKPDGCIIARRKLRYSPHDNLRLPVTLYSQCIGVPCDASSTCNYLGQCVPSDVDPGSCESAAGCAPAGEPPPVPGEDGGVPPGPGRTDAGGDARDVDASDAKDDADAEGGKPLPEAGAGAGSADSVWCGDRACPLGNMGQCCLDQMTGTGTCVQGGMTCAVASNIVRVGCDGVEDCHLQGTTCCAVASNTTTCMSFNTCSAGGFRELCHDAAGCLGGGACMTMFAIYNACK